MHVCIPDTTPMDARLHENLLLDTRLLDTRLLDTRLLDTPDAALSPPPTGRTSRPLPPAITRPAWTDALCFAPPHCRTPLLRRTLLRLFPALVVVGGGLAVPRTSGGARRTSSVVPLLVWMCLLRPDLASAISLTRHFPHYPRGGKSGFSPPSFYRPLSLRRNCLRNCSPSGHFPDGTRYRRGAAAAEPGPSLCARAALHCRGTVAVFPPGDRSGRGPAPGGAGRRAAPFLSTFFCKRWKIKTRRNFENMSSTSSRGLLENKEGC